MAPTLHSNKNGRENTFFTERRHSELSAVGLTGAYETPPIALAEVRKKCAYSILVRENKKGFLSMLEENIKIFRAAGTASERRKRA